MAAPSPPQVPADIEDLANWDIPIVALDIDSNSGPPRGQYNLLRRQIIPELINSSTDNPRLIQFLRTFQHKIMPVTDKTAKNIDTIITENSTRSHPPIVLMLSEDMINNFAKLVKSTGNRRVVKNTGDSPFRIVEFEVGFKCLLSPYFAKEWTRMQVAGLIKKWNIAQEINFLLRRTKKKISKRKYLEVVQQLFGSPKENAEFHEATSVSLELINPLFSICLVLVGLSFGAMLAEMFVSFKKSGKFTVQGISYGLLRLIVTIVSHIGRCL